MDLYIEKKIHPSIYFNTPHPHPILRVLLRSSPKVILSWLRQFMKILRNTHPLLIPPPTTIKHKMVWRI